MMHRQFKGLELMNVLLAQLSVQVAPGGGGDDGGDEAAAPIPCALLRLPYRGGNYAAVAAMPTAELSTAAGRLAVALPGSGGAAVPYTSALAACRSAVLGGLANTAAAAASIPSAAPAAASTACINWQPVRTPLKLWLPRFELTYSAQLNDALCALGLAAPFVPGDLTRIAAEPGSEPVTDLAVGSVLHKVRICGCPSGPTSAHECSCLYCSALSHTLLESQTYIKVDEQGTEAAAATAVMLMRAALPVRQEELEVRFDRPFMFVVVHVPTSTALFVSEVYEPERW